MKITIPDKVLEETNNFGMKTGKTQNIFVFHAGLVLESKPLKGSAEPFLAYSIRKKLDELEPGAKEMELDKSEILFLQQGIEHLEKNERLIGSGWYYLIDALRGATETPDKKVSKA